MRAAHRLISFRDAARVTVLCVALAATASPAVAITLETYFLELSDRERGAYLTGFVELFAHDTARDDAYRECVDATGAAGLHEALSKTVLNDPRMLTYEATPWILYTAASLCNRPGTKPPPPPAVRQAEGVRDESGATSGLAGLERPEIETPAATDEPDHRTALLTIAGVVGGAALGLSAAVALGRLRRERSQRP